MKYVTLANRSGHTARFFAHDEAEAIRLAVSCGHVRKAANAKVVKVVDVCPSCFPHVGVAALCLSPRVYVAGATDQLSGTLHQATDCPGIQPLQDVQLDSGPFTPTGFGRYQ